MAYIKRSQLQRYSRTSFRKDSYRLSESSYHTRIFLSHSHKDRSLVSGVIGWLEEKGIHAYVDWLDDEMPKEICPETAHKIRQRISEADKFLLLATNNSLTSRWVPWELGCADGLKSAENIAVMTVDEEWEDFKGNEYIELYPRISDGNKGAGVFPPNLTDGKTLSGWAENKYPFSKGYSQVGIGHLYS